MRKLLCVLTALLLTAAMAGAEPAYVSQKDPDLARIAYWTDTYGESGCGPASTANALAAALNVTDPAESVLMAEDLLRLTTLRHIPDGHLMDIAALRYITLSPEARRDSWSLYPGLNTALDLFGGRVIQAGDITPEATVDALQSGQPLLLMQDSVSSGDFGGLLRLTDALYQAGGKDVRVTLGRVAVGNVAAATPFGCGQSGHFMTLTLQVGPFTEEGALTVVDSMPRAISDEETSRYIQRYPFSIDGWVHYRNLRAFRENFDIRRVDDCALSLRLTEAGLTAWREEPDRRAAQLQSLRLYGKCLLLITYPTDKE